MANLSNINNKFLVTTTGEVLIGQTSNNGNRLQITGADGASYIYLKTDVATTGGRIGFNGDDLRVFNQQAAGDLHLGTNGATKVRITSGGNMLLGSAADFSRLTVSNGGSTRSTITISDQNTASLMLTAGANQAATISVDGTHALKFNFGANVGTDGGSTRMIILNNGKVGIGTDSPDTDLQIITTGSSDQDGVLKIGGSAASLGLVIDYDQSFATVAKITSNPTYNNTGALMKLCVDGDGNPNQLVLKGDGNVGIHEAAPESKFEISDTTVGTGPTSLDSNFIMLTNKDISSGGEVWGIGFNARSGSTNFLGAFIQAYGYFQTNGNTGLIFGTRPGVTGTAVERMRIDSAGNVGIGTDSPLEKLNIVETTTTAGTFFPVAISGARYQADYGVGIAFRPENNSSSYANKTAIVASGGGYGYNMADLHFCFNNSTTIGTEVSLSDSKVVMKRDGKVGIGITPTSGKLTVFGTGAGNATVQIEGEGGADPYINFLANNTQHWSLGIDDSDSDKFKLSKHSALGTADYLVVNTSGQVGIGTSSPSAQLHNYSTSTSNIFISGYGTSSLNDWGAGHAMFVATDNGLLISKQNLANNTNRLFLLYQSSLGNSEFYMHDTSGATQIRLNSAGNSYINGGNIGIGLTNPGSQLSLSKSNPGIQLSLLDSDTTTGSGNYIRIAKAYNNQSANRLAGIVLGSNAGNFGQTMRIETAAPGAYWGDMEMRFIYNSGGNNTTITKNLLNLKQDGTITTNGEINMNGTAGQRGLRQNGVSNVSNSGYVAGNATLSFNYDNLNQGSVYIQCVFNHYGFITSYGCSRVTVFANGPNLQAHNIQSITSTGGGSWVITRVSHTRFNVSKTAGNYSGGGYYFINIIGNGIAYT